VTLPIAGGSDEWEVWAAFALGLSKASGPRRGVRLVRLSEIGSNKDATPGTWGSMPVSDARSSIESAFDHQELFAVDADLKRMAKGIIDRILHLRDSL
jgi:hypothetical protein